MCIRDRGTYPYYMLKEIDEQPTVMRKLIQAYTCLLYSSGLENVLYFLAMISINIGIFNLIPIPALDGGKIVLNILEAIRRKPLKQEIET